MKKLILSALMLTLSACAGGGGGGSGSSEPTTPATSIVNSWFSSLGSNYYREIQFKADGTYISLAYHNDTGTHVNLQVITGTYTNNGNTITLNSLKSSCSGSKTTGNVSYSLSSSQLAISTASVLVTYTKQTSSYSGSFSATYGCFDSNSNFTPGVYADLN